MPHTPGEMLMSHMAMRAMLGTGLRAPMAMFAAFNRRIHKGSWGLKLAALYLLSVGCSAYFIK